MNRSVLLYGDVNLAYRDGSRIWLESMAEVLVLTGSQVTILLKAFPPEGTPPFGAELGCTIAGPSPEHRSRGAGMTPAEARLRILELHAQEHFDVVLTRGHAIASELSRCDELSGRLWPYLTDGPGFDPFHAGDHEEELARIARTARRVLVQTEDARSVWEACVPAATGKTLLLPPMVPDRYFRDPAHLDEPRRRGTAEDPLRLVYSGKFARGWKSLEIPTLPRLLRDAGVHASLRMIGDKIQHSSDDGRFPTEMRAVMALPLEDVHWLGGLERDETLPLVETADLGLGWRDASLDTSLEVSTKLLEYAAAGVAPVVNRTRAHERLLGADYPLFVDDDITSTLTRGCDPEVRADALRRAGHAAQPYRSSACVQRLSQYFSTLEPDLEGSPPLPSPRGHGPVRVLFSSHDFKFAGELIDLLEQRDDLELRIDTWQRLAQHDPDSSAAAADWADVIICEWAGHNAVFHSRRKRPDQRLVVRFHGFEIRGAWLKDIDVEAVDAFVFVSDFYRREILEQTGWPESRTTVIPNVIDALDLQRDKLPDARFHLGMAGYVPMLKRPDRAIDLLETLLVHDDRFTLHLRGRPPWAYPWEWAKPVQRSAYEALLDRVRRSPRLRDRVLFEEFSPDMGSWFRGIGWILSPSAQETFHLAPVEGMASGAVPLVWSRPGAEEIFGPALHTDVEEIARSVLGTLSEPGAFERLGVAARELAQHFDVSAHRQDWLDLLTSERSTPLPLRGIPLAHLEEGRSPRSAAQTAAVLEAALSSGDLERARLAMEHPTAAAPKGTLVATRIRDLREKAALRNGLASGGWIPPAGLGRLHRTAAGADAVLDGATVVQDTELSATPVLVAADALVNAVRRERPVRLAAPPTAAGAIAAAIAARRTGVPLELTVQAEDALTRAEVEIPDLAHLVHTALSRTAAPVALSDLVVGLVADDFTRNAVARTVRTVDLPRYGWQEILRTSPVDVVLVESAWAAPGEDWFHGVAFHGDEQAADLRALLAHARAEGIPTVFWNREDPVHLNSFRVPAADFDTVLTSDARCIAEYMGTLPSRTAVVASLPFFADPSVFHPAASTTEDTDPARIAYAGSYYGERFPERTAELRGILEVATEHGLAIYDRQADLPQSPYRLPADLEPLSRGTAGVEAMPEVYRRHPVHVNVNSVNDSPTMFSRRVVEIAASGSVVLSGRGDGVRTVLGPSFPVLPHAEAWRTELDRVADDPGRWRAQAWEQLRVVHRQATSAHALTLALRIAGLPVAAPPGPGYAVLVPVSSRGASRVLLSQTLPPAAVAIGIDHPDRAPLAAAGIPLIALDEAAEDLARLIDEDGFVGVLSDRLPPTHYEDLLMASAIGPVDRILVRDEPAAEDDPFRLVSSAPPPVGPIAGSLYSRRVARTADDLTRSADGRTLVWIRGTPGADLSRGGA